MIKVAAAIIEKDSLVLIAQRKRGAHLPLKWEFPGGKIEVGETPAECLVREIKEEFDIEISIRGHFTNVQHDYGDKKIELLVYRAKYKSGVIKTFAHEQIKWVSKSDLLKYDLAAADIPVAIMLCGKISQ